MKSPSSPLRLLHHPPAEARLPLPEFLAWLKGPALFRLPGRDRSRARLLVGGLHGNEPSGFRALQALLREPGELAVETWLFLGNVGAALEPPFLTHRFRPGQADFNRVWRENTRGPLARVAVEVLDELKSGPPLEAAVDLHNNTGKNPAFSVVMSGQPERLGLSRWWTRLFVRYEAQPLGALVEELDRELPAIAVECGQVDDPAADSLALAGSRAYLAAASPFRGGRPLQEGEHLYASVARVQIPPHFSLAYGEDDGAADLVVSPELERWNFVELDAGTLVAKCRPGCALRVHDHTGHDVSEEFFETQAREIRLRRPVVPMMVTTDPRAARDDCLLYLADVEERAPSAAHVTSSAV